MRDLRRGVNLEVGKLVEAYLRGLPPGEWRSRQEIADVLHVSAQQISLAVIAYSGVLECVVTRAFRGQKGKGGFVRLRPAIDPRVKQHRGRYRAMVERLWEMGVRDIRPKRKPKRGDQ
jgi:hypothetical protein